MEKTTNFQGDFKVFQGSFRVLLCFKKLPEVRLTTQNTKKTQNGDQGAVEPVSSDP